VGLKSNMLHYSAEIQQTQKKGAPLFSGAPPFQLNELSLERPGDLETTTPAVVQHTGGHHDLVGLKRA
jgi:kynurenine formamidase